MASIEPVDAGERPRSQGLTNQDQHGERERRRNDENNARECRPAPGMEHHRRHGKRPTCRDEPIPEQRGGHSSDRYAQYEERHGEGDRAAEVVERCKCGEHLGRVHPDSQQPGNAELRHCQNEDNQGRGGDTWGNKGQGNTSQHTTRRRHDQSSLLEAAIYPAHGHFGGQHRKRVQDKAQNDNGGR